MKKSKPTAQSTRLTALETRQAELEARIAHLEREVHRNFPNPWITPVGPYPSAPPVLPQPMEDLDDARCHVCNGRFKDMTGYVCNHPRCPSRVTCGDVAQPIFTCGSIIAAGPYGAPGTIPTFKNNPIT